jgi:hypothetical protein
MYTGKLGNGTISVVPRKRHYLEVLGGKPLNWSSVAGRAMRGRSNKNMNARAHWDSKSYQFKMRLRTNTEKVTYLRNLLKRFTKTTYYV